MLGPNPTFSHLLQALGLWDLSSQESNTQHIHLNFMLLASMKEITCYQVISARNVFPIIQTKFPIYFQLFLHNVLKGMNIWKNQICFNYYLYSSNSG